jgi:vancomycin permeability regulator SanA
VGFLRRHLFLTVAISVVLAILGVLLASGVAVWQAAHDDEARRVDHVDLIVVLGAAEYNGRPSPTFEGRLRQAANLFRKGFSDRVLVVGGKQPGDRTTEAEAGRSWLVSQGLPESGVSAQPVGNSTLESLRGAATYMQEQRLESAFLVSDPWHNLRIRKMARDLGIRAFVSATWHSAARSEWTRLSGYSRETFAYIYYRVLGR